MERNIVTFAAERSAEIVAELPAQRAVYLLRGEPGSEPYVAKTADLRRRLEHLLGTERAEGKRLNLRQRCRKIEYALTGSDFESRLVLFKILRAEFPRGSARGYRQRMKLRPAPLIKFNFENPYPRAYVTRRITRLHSQSRYYGPFPSRAAAEKFLNSVLDFFKMRRCDFDLNPDPSFPGCMYSEMKMCLAPCFKGCSDESYHEECARVRQFFETRGESLLRETEAERERASQNLEFESAAALHGRMEKIRGILGASSLPEIVRPIDKLDAVIVQRAARMKSTDGPGGEADSVALFRVQQGRISDPLFFTPMQASEISAQSQTGPAKIAPRSMESRIAELLASAPAETAKSGTELSEHLALLKRWYYRSRRDGEIFFADEKGELPLRRIVRGIGRVLKGEKPEGGESDEALRAYWLARTREAE